MNPVNKILGKSSGYVVIIQSGTYGDGSHSQSIDKTPREYIKQKGLRGGKWVTPFIYDLEDMVFGFGKTIVEAKNRAIKQWKKYLVYK